MRYKRFSPTGDTFLVTDFEPVFRETEFFNSYGPFHSVFQNGIVSDMAIIVQLSRFVCFVADRGVKQKPSNFQQ